MRFLKTNKPEPLAIMRDYLKISGDYVEKIYQFAMRSLNEDGLVAKNSLDNEIRLAREQLKIKNKSPNPRSPNGNLSRRFSLNDNPTTPRRESVNPHSESGIRNPCQA